MKAPFRSTITLSCISAALTIAACASDDRSSAAPTGPATDLLSSQLSIAPTDTVTTVFVIDPSATATYQIAGGHRLWVQQGGLCDLTSAYGPGLWDDACELAKEPVVVTARSWLDADAHPHVDFSPALRFAPLDDRRASAELYLKDKSTIDASTAVILYCNEKECVDEGLADSSMLTQRDKQQGFVYRRIKHFSGYQVSTGRDDEGTPPDSTTYQP